MVSHNKEADQTVKTQNFPASKTLTGSGRGYIETSEGY